MNNLYAKKKNSKGKIHPSPSNPSLSVLSVLPSAIVTLVSVLSIEEQEVLAYLIVLSTATTTSFNKKKCNKPTSHCGCFECYTRFWIRWDSSPNRHLIHQAIEAFEDHLSLSDYPPNKTHKPKLRNRLSTDKSDMESVSTCPEPDMESVSTCPEPEMPQPITPSDASAETTTDGGGEDKQTGNRMQQVAAVQEQMGLVRKVWPDVLGLFNSRLWKLWGPSV